MTELGNTEKAPPTLVTFLVKVSKDKEQKRTSYKW